MDCLIQAVYHYLSIPLLSTLSFGIMHVFLSAFGEGAKDCEVVHGMRMLASPAGDW